MYDSLETLCSLKVILLFLKTFLPSKICTFFSREQGSKSPGSNEKIHEKHEK